MSDGEFVAPVLQLIPGARPQTSLKGYSFCQHPRTELDESTRTVLCLDCGKTLDPFDVLVGYARLERRLQWSRGEERAADQRVAALKEEERKIKARTRAASRKDADAAVAADRARTERECIEITLKAREIAGLCGRIERLARAKREKGDGEP